MECIKDKLSPGSYLVKLSGSSCLWLNESEIVIDNGWQGKDNVIFFHMRAADRVTRFYYNNCTSVFPNDWCKQYSA